MPLLPRYIPLAAVLMGLAGCAGTTHLPPTAKSLSEVNFAPNPNPSRGSRLPQRAEPPDELQTPEAYTDIGGRPRAGPANARAAPAAPEQDVSVQLEQADVREAADVVLGRQLGLAYTVDPRVQGEITLSSNAPLGRDDLLATFESALEGVGATLLELRGGSYEVVPLQGAPLSGQVVGLAGGPPRLKPGNGATAIKLSHIGAVAASQFVGPMVRQPDSVRVDPARNMLLVVGSRAEREAVVGVLADIDTDWLAHRAVGLFPLREAAPDAVVPELVEIFGATDPGTRDNNGIRLVPVRRLHAIMAVAPDADTLRAIGAWVRRLDRGTDGGTRLFVRELDHAAAPEVAKLLAGIYGRPATVTGAAPGPAPPATMAPQQPAAPPQAASPYPAEAETPRAEPTVLKVANEQPAAVPTPTAPQAAEPPPGPSPVDAATAPSAQFAADATNNLLLIRASPQDYGGMEEALDALDAAPPQVLVEATVVEVTLNDALRFGVQYFLKEHGGQAAFSSGTGTVAIGPRQTVVDPITNTATQVLKNALEPLAVTPGLNILLGQGDSFLAIDALRQLTNVRVLSSPSVVVQDGRDATLTVGDSVPVETQSAQSVLTVGAPIVNSIEYRNTGVILQVRPHIGREGTVAMDLAQEVSRVAPQPTGGQNTLAPTITQRRVTSRLEVEDGQTVALAGMIGQDDRRDRARVPVLGDIPIIGALFGSTVDSRERTELLVFLTPRVIRDPGAARTASDELRSQLSLMKGDADYGRTGSAPDVRRSFEPTVYERPRGRRGPAAALARLVSRRAPEPPPFAPTLAELRRRLEGEPEPTKPDDRTLPPRGSVDDAEVAREVEAARKAGVPESWLRELTGVSP